MSFKSCVSPKPFGVAARARLSTPVLPIRRLARVCTVNAVKPEKDAAFDLENATLFGAAGLLTPYLLHVESALAQKGELGIVEGRIASLTHPVLMGFLFVASLYTAWLGFQWR